MLRLALAAIMLMALVPSLGRLAGNGPAAGVAHAMHANGGHGSHAGHGGPGTPAAPTVPQPGGAAHYDCGYCPLLASAVPPAPVHLTLPSGHHDARLPVRAANPLLAWRHPWGLGSRGPPHA